MKIEWHIEVRKLSALKEWEKNPRLLMEKGLADLKKSIEKFGLAEPLVINTDGMICGGHGRLKILLQAGIKECDCYVPNRKLTEDEFRELNIRLNANIAGVFDFELLANEWDSGQLVEWGMDLPVNFGMGEPEEDNFQADPPKNPITKIGDVYELNQHRISCGDSTDATVVEKTLAGAKPILMVTDPPYGVNYDPTWRHRAGIINSRRQGKVENEEKVNWQLAYSLFSGDVIYVWHGGRHAKEVAQNIEDCGFEIVCQIVWNKQQMVFSRGDYHWKHEPCWYAVRKGQKHNYQGDRKQTTVWDITSILQSKVKEDAAQTHGTQKPIECMARPIRNNTYERQSVYDPFLGSGTTLIAAEQLNRACYGQEISPAYCDMIVARFIKLKGESEITIKRNGQTLSKKELQQYLQQIETGKEK